MHPVLVVGVRSPAAVELVRQLIFHGLTVEGADFLHFPLGRFCRGLRHYHRLPSPRWRTAEFETAWARLLQRPYAAVLACNEEIFWLSRSSAQPKLPGWDHPDKLERLHRKDHFVELTASLGLPAPKSRGGSVVLKRVYSRFGESTWLDPTPEQLRNCRDGWVVQEKLTGPTECLSAFAWRGELIAGCCYLARWGTLRGQDHLGAGLFFQKVERAALWEQARALVKHLNFSGPIGLDFVGGVAVECNPRWTSGVHLMDCTPVFAALGLPVQSARPGREVAQLAGPMILRATLRAEFWRDWRRAPDVIWSAPDPGPALVQPLALLETAWRALRAKISLHQALTWDMEWNGPGDIAGI